MTRHDQWLREPYDYEDLSSEQLEEKYVPEWLTSEAEAITTLTFGAVADTFEVLVRISDVAANLHYALTSGPPHNRIDRVVTEIACALQGQNDTAVLNHAVKTLIEAAECLDAPEWVVDHLRERISD